MNKRIFVVNWYTLPETNTVAPEAMVRNLLLGHKMAAESGGGMKSGYTATSYGQLSQLPQLYRGFGIENAIFYCGINKYVLTPLFDWQAPDGSTISTLRTFDEVTRTNWFFYVHGPDVHKKSLDNLLRQTEPYKIGNEILALNMEDNDEPLSSYASAYGKQYPATNLQRAWSALLKNHAHDSICGAAVDRAHEDMMYNFSLAKTVAEECTNRSVKWRNHKNNAEGFFPFQPMQNFVDVSGGAGVCSIRLAGYPTIGFAGGNIESSGTKALCDYYADTFEKIWEYIK
ncbi:MAG: hypothetical protein HFE46_08815 [Clostridia bacterium]|nr:hypothetical protein [Clostridia bacterium]